MSGHHQITHRVSLPRGWRIAGLLVICLLCGLSSAAGESMAGRGSGTEPRPGPAVDHEALTTAVTGSTGRMFHPTPTAGATGDASPPLVPFPLGPWLMRGPFPAPVRTASGSLWAKEGTALAARSRPASLAEPAWQAFPADLDASATLSFFDLLPFPQDHREVLAATRVTCARPVELLLLYGADDSCRVWWDGVCVGEKTFEGGCHPRSCAVTVRAPAGEHLLVFQVRNDGGGWGFSVQAERLSDPVAVRAAWAEALTRAVETLPAWPLLLLAEAQARSRRDPWSQESLEEGERPITDPAAALARLGARLAAPGLTREEGEAARWRWYQLLAGLGLESVFGEIRRRRLDVLAGPPEHLYGKALAAFHLGDLARARELLRLRRLRLPDDLPSLLLEARIHDAVHLATEDVTHYQEAGRLYREIVRRFPTSAEGWMGLAWNLRQNEQWDAMGSPLQEAYRLRPPSFWGDQLWNLYLLNRSPAAPRVPGDLILRRADRRQSRDLWRRIVP